MREENHIIKTTFNKIMNVLSWEEAELREHLACSEKDFSAFQEGRSDLAIFHIYELARCLDLDPVKLAKGEIDYLALYQHQKGNLAALPERYAVNPTSRVRTAQNVVNFLEIISPEHLIKILKKLQINLAGLIHPESTINVRLVDDIYREMMKLGYPSESFILLAEEGAKNYKNSLPFYSRFKGVDSPRELFESFLDDHIKYIDRNWNYQILESDEEGMLFKVTTNLELQEFLKEKSFGSWGFTMHRLGFVKGLASYLKMDNLEVNLRETIHDNYDHCLYELKYPKRVYH